MHSIEIDPETTISEAGIASQIFEDSQLIKFAYHGSFLDDSVKISSLNLEENDFIVIYQIPEFERHPKQPQNDTSFFADKKRKNKEDNHDPTRPSVTALPDIAQIPNIDEIIGDNNNNTIDLTMIDTEKLYQEYQDKNIEIAGISEAILQDPEALEQIIDEIEKEGSDFDGFVDDRFEKNIHFCPDLDIFEEEEEIFNTHKEEEEEEDYSDFTDSSEERRREEQRVNRILRNFRRNQLGEVFEEEEEEEEEEEDYSEYEYEYEYESGSDEEYEKEREFDSYEEEILGTDYDMPDVFEPYSEEEFDLEDPYPRRRRPYEVRGPFVFTDEDQDTIIRLQNITGLEATTVIQVYLACNRDENETLNCLLSMNI
ncbi:hypothetical protein TRFO_05953 [Tritrichomonas foetus]|uniref:Uncharacterized protein n=1 Tax=Tritrichomonas foetus TaxID=1144522 RepID=A0A1J4K327_9EUKA|nr:hypothetical protein TRFO_05953 [Tritrichomonas foetus]|eukprot:OHT05370.1 hypothetical protein TRFO_05953 [Tritrichomonas foetus]